MIPIVVLQFLFFFGFTFCAFAMFGRICYEEGMDD